MASVAKRYARALFDVAKDRDQIDAVEQDLQFIVDVLDENPTFASLLFRPHIAHSVKKAQINDVFGKYVQETTHTFLQLLVDRDRESELAEAADYYVEFANEHRNMADAHVISAAVLTDEQSQALQRKLSEVVGKAVRIHNRVNDKLVGGLIIHIGDRRFDGSIKGKLDRFKRRVLTSKM